MLCKFFAAALRAFPSSTRAGGRADPFRRHRLEDLELAARSSVIIGIVGAGGIGQELKSAFELSSTRRPPLSAWRSSWSFWEWDN